MRVRLARVAGFRDYVLGSGNLVADSLNLVAPPMLWLAPFAECVLHVPFAECVLHVPLVSQE